MKCPYCGKDIRDESIVCKYCSRAVATTQASVPAGEATKADQVAAPREGALLSETFFSVTWSQNRIPNETSRFLLTINLPLPNECAWCGSKNVTGRRMVWVYNGKNPYFKGTGSKAAASVFNAASTLALGGLGGQLVKVDTPKTADIENYLIGIEAPHCEHHATGTEAFMQWMGFEGEFSGKVRIFRPELAQAIQTLAGSVKALIQEEGNTALKEKLYSSGKFYFSSLEALKWPTRCVVCGEPNPTASYTIHVTGAAGKLENAKVPICEKDEKNRSKAEKLNSNGALISSLVALGMGIASFWLFNLDQGTHVLCCIGLPIILVLVGMGLTNLYGRLIYSRSADDFRPVSIAYEKDKNRYSFKVKTSENAGRVFFREMLELNMDHIEQVVQ